MGAPLYPSWREIEGSGRLGWLVAGGGGLGLEARGDIGAWWLVCCKHKKHFRKLSNFTVKHILQDDNKNDKNFKTYAVVIICTVSH